MILRDGASRQEAATGVTPGFARNRVGGDMRRFEIAQQAAIVAKPVKGIAGGG
jgi:hypothetical protein